MNTKQRLKNLRNIAPDYQRISHFNRQISQMTHDDIELESPVEFPLECWIQEKVDGANMGVSWTSGPVLRNRNHILKKGYIEKDTPAKLQFRPAWNWLHQHDFRNGLSEGIVVKTSEGRFLKDTWKVVNRHFERRDDFNLELIRNKLK